MDMLQISFYLFQKNLSKFITNQRISSMFKFRLHFHFSLKDQYSKLNFKHL